VRGKAVGREEAAEPYPLFVFVWLSDHCRLALVVLLIFILIFIVFIIVIIGISTWGPSSSSSLLLLGFRRGAEMPVRLNQVRGFSEIRGLMLAFKSVWIAAGRRHFA
jgi:hypothetical protein